MTNEDAGELRRQLDKAKQMIALNERIDDLIEESLQARRSLADTMSHVLPALCAMVGAKQAFIRSFAEDLSLTTVTHPRNSVVPCYDEVLDKTGRDGDAITLARNDVVVVAQPLDVAGEWFGQAGVVLDASSKAAQDPEHSAALLNVMCEEVDNFLYSIRAARERHQVMMALGDALKHRVLAEGLQNAVGVLAKSVPLDRLLLVVLAEEDASSTVHVQVFEKGKLQVDTMGALPAHPDQDAIREEALSHLRSGDDALLRRFGFERAQEEVLINGVTTTTVVGKLLVTSNVGAFNTYDRELLSGFSGFIRQRVVDFNKEWRTLHRSFRAEDVARLLIEDGYEKRYLSPREANVGIVFIDISGFTKLSETVLKTPSNVAELVERWSHEAVDLVWKHGGVFDKMVGDCIIALFGPPFYDVSESERARRAIECARDIRAMTVDFPSRPGFEHLRESGLAVSTGVNLAPLFVGHFGPNDNFTGFSSGMNNTARLQGCADRNEILVMREAITALGDAHGFTFGAERDAKVKNVAEPLRFSPLLG
jgi:class 3 adenylate cyclase